MPKSSSLEEQQPASPVIYRNFVEACGEKGGFLQHVKQTHQPESYPGLSHTKPPTKDAKFLLVVDEFQVDPSKRPDGEMIRCAACATKKKFSKGSLAWYPGEGVLRVVGNECGDERRAEANEDYKRRNTLSVLNAYLDQHLLSLHTEMARIEATREPARHAQELSLKLKTQARSFCETVNRAIRDGDGRLRIYQSEVDENSREDRSVTIFRPIGLGFLRNSYQPLKRIDEAIFRLKQADHGPPSKARRWLESRRENLTDLNAAYVNISHALGRASEAEAMIREALEFLSADNLEGIDAWSGARHMQLRARWSKVFITFIGPAKGGAKPQMTTLYPKWALLRD